MASDFIKSLQKEVDERNAREKPKSSLTGFLPDFTPKKDAAPTTLLETVKGYFAPLGRERTEEEEALDLLSANALLLGAPTKALSMAGVTGPQEAIEKARELVGPTGTAIAEGAGMLPSSLVMGGGGLLRQMGKGAAYGTTTGAGLSKRGEEIPSMVGYGALGAVAPAVAPVIGFGAGAVSGLSDVAKSLLKSPLEKGLMRIGGRMQAQGLTDVGEEALSSIRPSTFAEDVAPATTGEGLESLLRQASSPAGPARTETLGLLTAREASRPSRITDELSVLPKGSVDDAIEEAAGETARILGPAYKSALDDFQLSGYEARKNFLNTQDPASGMILREIMENDLVAQAVKKGLKAEKERLGVKVPKGALILTKNPKKEMPNLMRVLDQAKRELDRRAKKVAGKGDSDLSVRLGKAREAFVGALDEANPSYKPARAISEKQFNLKSAADAGKSIFATGKKAPTPNQIKQTVSSYTPNEKKVFRMGVSQKVRELIDDNKVTDISKLLKNKNLQALKSAWPDEGSFNKFVSTLRAEVKMAESAKKMSSSTPVEGIQDMGLLEVAGGSVTPAVTGRLGAGSAKSAAFVLGGNIMKNLTGAGKMGMDEASEVASRLLASTPEARKAVLKELVDGGYLTPKASNRVLSSMSSLASGASSGLLGVSGRLAVPTVKTQLGLLSGE